MPTADREGLREALVDQIARVIDPGAHHLGKPDYYGPEPILSSSSARVRVARKRAFAIIAGPLAPMLAQADTAAQAADDLVTAGLRNLALSAEVEALRAALKPFAAVCDAEHMRHVHDEQVLEVQTRAEVTLSERLRGMHFRAARTALAAGQDKEGGKP